ncbi:nuclease [Synechococcus sp. MU1650]|nr:thermonuclease family protein [Synechococcus sp. MU1650]MCB4378257.1 nuclease [Synechococcus sp. MU1650]
MIKRTAFLFITFWSLPASGSTIISVGDGDTIRIRDGSEKLTVRLACIDAPEISQNPYGSRSRDFLKKMLPLGTKVTLRIQTIDRYGRSVAEVFTKKGNINESIIEQGHGFVYRRYLSKCNGSRYLSLERQAQKLGLGVWSTSSTGIQRPWDYRRSKRSVSSSFKREYRCKEIASWNKAQQLLKEGHTYLDRDRDGEACESLR